MAEHLIPITISVDDETIEKKAMEYASKTIADEVMKVTHKVDRWSDKVIKGDTTPLKEMVESQISELLKAHSDEIIQNASLILANKLLKSKKIKDYLSSITSESEEI